MNRVDSAPTLPVRSWLENDAKAERSLLSERRIRIDLWRACESFIDVINGDVDVKSLVPDAFTFLLDARPLPQPTITCAHQHLLGARALIEAAGATSEYHVRMSMSSSEVLVESPGKAAMAAVGVKNVDVQLSIDGSKI
jgi:hypothetical protein